MPVQAATTSATSSALTCSSTMRRAARRGAGLGELALRRRDLGVLQPRRRLQVAVALRALDGGLQVVEPLLELADPVEAGLLLLPPGGQALQLLLPVGEVAAQALEPLAAGVVVLLVQRELLHPHPVDGALQLVDLDRLAVDLHPQPRRRLVDEVDGLVGQEARGDVPVGQRGGGDQRGVADVDLVVRLVAALEPAQDRDGVLDAGSPTSTCWKRRSRAGSFSMPVRYSSSVVAPTMRSSPRASIGLSMLPASIEPSALPAPTTVCSSSMKVMISPVGLGDLLQHGLEPLLELAAVLRAGDHGAEVEADDALVLERLGTSPATIALREPLDDGGLADAGLADEHRVVLGAAAEHLHHAADLGVAADDGVEVAPARALGEVDAVLLQRLVGRLRVLVGDPPDAAAHLGERVDELLRQPAALAADALEQVGDLAALGGQADQQVLGADVVVLRLAAASCAACIEAMSARDSCGAATLEPWAAGSDRSCASARERTCATSTPTASSSAPAMPSGWSSRASSRWTGATSGWPSVEARRTAVLTASWLLVVRRSASMRRSSCSRCGSPDSNRRQT
jgi:hypothetical protein